MNMQSYRVLTLILFWGLTFFLVAVGAVTVTAWWQEKEAGVLTSQELSLLKKELQEQPKDEALKVEIRVTDLLLRRQHFQNRKRLEAAPYLLIPGGFLWVALLGWLLGRRSMEAPLPGNVAEEVRLLQEEMAEMERLLEEKRYRLEQLRCPPEKLRPLSPVLAGSAVALVGLFCLGGLALTGFYFGRPLEEKPAPTLESAAPKSESAPEEKTTAQTIEPLDSAPAQEIEPLEAAAEIAVHESPDFEDNWPCFRGPGNLGLAGPGPFPRRWDGDSGTSILWTVEVPHAGKSSAILWADRIFLSGGTAELHHLLCYDRATGERLWDRELAGLSGGELEIFEDTGFAAPTPCTDGRVVCALFPTGKLAAWDFDGRELWQKDLGVPESMYGFATSLMMYEGLLLVQYDQGSDPEQGLSRLYAYEGVTGREVYAQPRPVANSWSSPALIPAEGGIQLVTTGPEWIISYRPKTGEEIWRVGWRFADMAPCPTFGNGLVYVTNDQAALMAIRPDGEGNVTETHVVWESEDGLPDTASPVTDGEFLLQVAAGGYLTCLNAKTGELLWEKYLDAMASASPILADGLIYLACQDGSTRLFPLAGQFEPQEQNALPDPTYATPAFGDGKIYIRTSRQLVAIGE